MISIVIIVLRQLRATYKGFKMNAYTITEKQDLFSIRDGYLAECLTLKSAKIIASKRQSFFDTVLTIEQDGQMIAYKKSNKWIQVNYD